MTKGLFSVFKDNFKALLDSLDPNFPISEWDSLLEQPFITLNLVRAARSNQKLSAHTFLNGNFEFNETPLSLPVTKVVIHSKPTNYAS